MGHFVNNDWRMTVFRPFTQHKDHDRRVLNGPFRVGFWQALTRGHVHEKSSRGVRPQP